MFDYIHGRALATCFKDPSFVIKQAFAALEPGGYLELQDGIVPFQYIGPPPIKSSFYKWNNLLVEGSVKGGRPWNNVQHYKKWMEETGFVSEVKKFYNLPRWLFVPVTNCFKRKT